MKRKFIYFLTAFVMAITLSVSGVGNSYIKAEASSGLLDPLWNTDKSFEENIGHHMLLWANVIGVAISPNLLTGGSLLITGAQFYEFMTSEGYSEDVANAVCHGGGGFVRDGINRDKDGNVTYSDEVSDLFYRYICNYLATDSGYTVATYMSYDDFPVEWFESVELRNNTVNFLKSSSYRAVVFVLKGSASTTSLISIKSLGSCTDFVLERSSFFLPHVSKLLIPGGTEHDYFGAYDVISSSTYSDNLIGSLRNGSVVSGLKTSGSPVSFLFYKAIPNSYDIEVVASKTGGLCKIWNSNYDYFNRGTKDTNYYYSSNWLDYDSYSDNSMTISNSEYQYYSDNSSTIYNNIQYNIDNGGDNLTEDDIRRIVDDTLKDFLDNLPDEEEDNNDDDNGNDFIIPDDSVSGNDTGGNGTGGNGLSNLLTGIGSFFDFLLSLIGGLIGLISEFLASAMSLLGSLTSFTDGFAAFLSSAFMFLPEEAVSLICSGIGLIITLGIIKYLRN